ncbi:uncharacterized protein LOC141850657 isoform X2 [Brevipalpus obovatus]|uniref:uncharacterized protein LOC141850657 isoform X2 n=1 Tax=Brevipalpus obovatus TaxID=246614 RepID=UPI003D9F1B55
MRNWARILIHLFSIILLSEGGFFTPANAEDYRYMVLIKDAKSTTHIGAGTIFFWGKWILTTRDNVADVSRIDNDSGSKRYVISKTRDLRIYPKSSNKLSEVSAGKFWVPEKIFCHPFLDKPNEMKHHTDIAVIKLKGSIPLDPLNKRSGYQAIELYEEDYSLAPVTHLKIAGWGTFDPLPDDPPMSEDLMETAVDLATNCPKNISLKPLANLCLNWGLRRFCKGDFGGPAVLIRTDCPHCSQYWKYHLYGVLSSNSGRDCSAGYPHILNVTYFRDFIDNVRRHEPAEYECKNMENGTSFQNGPFKKLNKKLGTKKPSRKKADLS